LFEVEMVGIVCVSVRDGGAEREKRAVELLIEDQLLWRFRM
jgi:hypothetical protein